MWALLLLATSVFCGHVFGTPMDSAGPSQSAILQPSGICFNQVGATPTLSERLPVDALLAPAVPAVFAAAQTLLPGAAQALIPGSGRKRSRRATNDTSEPSAPPPSAPIGRPPKRRAAPRPPVGDPSYPRVRWSVTISKQKHHIPSSWFQNLASALPNSTERAAISLEIGVRNHKLHIQGILDCHCPATEIGKDLLRTWLKQQMQTQVGDGCYMFVKPFDAGQEWTYMLGYVQKDAHKDTYDLHHHGISETELVTSRTAYNTIRLDYEQGRTVITKSSLFKQVYQFWHTHLSYMQPPLPLMLKFMLQTNRYIPGAGWLITGQGRGLHLASAEAMWKLIRDPCTVTLDDVWNVFFTQPGSPYELCLVNSARDHDMTFEEAVQTNKLAKDGDVTKLPGYADFCRRNFEQTRMAENSFVDDESLADPPAELPAPSNNAQPVDENEDGIDCDDYDE